MLKRSKLKPLGSYFMLTLVSILISGCSVLSPVSSSAVDQPRTVFLSPDVHWTIPTPDTLSGDFALTQSVQAQYGEQTYDLIFQVEKVTDQLVIVALTHHGQPLLQVSYDSKGIKSVVSPLIGHELPLEYIVSDFMLAFGQQENLSKNLKAAQANTMFADNRRIISFRNDTLITIEYQGQINTVWPRLVTLKNLTLGYQLKIETIQIGEPVKKS